MAIDKDAARAHLSACGVDFKADFHALPLDHIQALIDYARAHGYRPPKHSSGSTGRYFFAMLTRPQYETQHVVQGHYGQGWEDLCASLTRRESISDIRAYRENAPGAYRLIARRVKKEF